MSDKMECPVCDSYTSSVASAVNRGEPCPNCGTPARMIVQITKLREKRADEQLKTELEIALVDLDSVTRQRNELALLVRRMRDELTRPTVIELLDEIRNQPTC